MKILRTHKFSPLENIDPETYKHTKNYTTPVKANEVIDRYESLVLPIVSRLIKAKTPGYPEKSLKENIPFLIDGIFYLGGEELMHKTGDYLYKNDGLLFKREKQINDPHEIILNILNGVGLEGGASSKVRKLAGNLAKVYKDGKVEENKNGYWNLKEVPEFKR